MAVEVTDRIEKKVFLRAPRARVWRAVADAEEFGKWFGVDLTGRAIDVQRDYSKEPTTLVVFELADAPGGTMLTVTESGFDRIPPDRRDDAYRGNESGWTQQMVAIEKYIGAPA